MLKHILVMLATVATLCLAACNQQIPASKPNQETSDARTMVVTELVSALSAGDVEAATARFDSQMRAVMPTAKLTEVWNGVTQQFGAFKRQLETRTEKIQGFDVVFVTCEFERGKLDIQVTLNAAQQVSGLFIRPSTR